MGMEQKQEWAFEYTHGNEFYFCLYTLTGLEATTKKYVTIQHLYFSACVKFYVHSLLLVSLSLPSLDEFIRFFLLHHIPLGNYLDFLISAILCWMYIKYTIFICMLSGACLKVLQSKYRKFCKCIFFWLTNKKFCDDCEWSISIVCIFMHHHISYYIYIFIYIIRFIDCATLFVTNSKWKGRASFMNSHVTTFFRNTSMNSISQ